MKSSRNKRTKSFFDLTPAERDREVARFDREIDLEKETRPLTLKERALFEKMRGSPVRSLYLLRLDSKLIAKANQAAKKNGMTLDEFISSSIRGMVAFSQR